MLGIMLSVLRKLFMWLSFHYNNFMMLKWLFQGHTAKKWRIWNQKLNVIGSSLLTWVCVH